MPRNRATLHYCIEICFTRKESSKGQDVT